MGGEGIAGGGYTTTGGGLDTLREGRGGVCERMREGLRGRRSVCHIFAIHFVGLVQIT